MSNFLLSSDIFSGLIEESVSRCLLTDCVYVPDDASFIAFGDTSDLNVFYKIDIDNKMVYVMKPKECIEWVEDIEMRGRIEGVLVYLYYRNAQLISGK